MTSMEDVLVDPGAGVGSAPAMGDRLGDVPLGLLVLLAQGNLTLPGRLEIQEVERGESDDFI